MPRHAEFDRDNVIDQATSVFWERGYAKTSVGDLVSATGLQPGSLYAAFGNKKGLFLEVIDQYNRGFVGRIRALRDTPGRSTSSRACCSSSSRILPRAGPIAVA